MSARTLAVDAMGGDVGPACTVPASLQALACVPALSLVLVGELGQMRAQLPKKLPVGIQNRLQLEAAGEVIGMDESPALALRGKRDSSMRRALEQVQGGKVAACVSAGNSGALLALSRHLLKTLPGIERPALVRAVPTQKGHCLLLDLGANLDCTATQLVQFALLGGLAAEALGKAKPKVALLNVGSEDIKGNREVKQAHSLLQQAVGCAPFDYIGYIEGHDLFRGAADVAVCDGFVGNLLLKSSEGLARLLADKLRAEFKRNFFSRLSALPALPVLRRLKQQLSPAQHNGASLLGLRGIVVKSHGGADIEGFKNAILHAHSECACNLPQHLYHHLSAVYPQSR